jgi:hypothetical protein
VLLPGRHLFDGRVLLPRHHLFDGRDLLPLHHLFDGRLLLPRQPLNRICYADDATNLISLPPRRSMVTTRRRVAPGTPIHQETLAFVRVSSLS